MSAYVHARGGEAGALAAALAPGDPFPVPLRVQRLRLEIDWDGCLPDRASTTSWRVQQQIKRVIDVIGALVALALLGPLMIVVALLVKLTSPGPVFYVWHALGHRARPFIGYKFRTMVQDADALKPRYLHCNEMSGPVFKLRHDPRVTPLGRFLRKYSIDELPQLWSVLKGDMSLVGPRPPTPEEFAQYEERHCAKLAVIPGITCIWQVSGRTEISDFEQWMELDRAYIRDWNLALDARILLQTLPAVLAGRGAY